MVKRDSYIAALCNDGSDATEFECYQRKTKHRTISTLNERLHGSAKDLRRQQASLIPPFIPTTMIAHV